jgi:hypothetical protein
VLARRSKSVFRPLALAAILTAATVGCGGGSDTESSGKDSGADGTQTSATTRIESVNKTMRETSFSSTGTTTAFEGATQKTSWDPEQGFRMEVTGAPQTAGGEMYCKDGTSYTSAPLFAAMLGAKGQQITVPERLSDVYVSSETGGDCAAFFALAPTGEYAPAKDTTVDGRKAVAIEVSSGPSDDTYLISAEAPDHLLRQEASRDGKTSTTTYTDFGKEMTISMPAEDKTMTMAEFRTAIGAG